MVNIKVDTSKFDRTFAEYAALSKRAITELIIKTAFFVARNCVNLTRFVPKDRIKASLEATSRVSKTARIADILTNKIRTSRGLPGLSGNKLRVEANKFIRKGQTGSKFVASGFLWAVKDLSPYVQNKGGAPRMSATIKSNGQRKGGGTANPSGNSWDVKASIYNSVLGSFKKWYGAPGRNIAKVQQVEMEGAQAALNAEESNKRAYIEKKMNELAQKFNNA